jgi:proteasome-associated ATPase
MVMDKIKRTIEARLGKKYLSDPTSEENLWSYINRTELELEDARRELDTLNKKIMSLADRTGFRGVFLEFLGDRRALVAIGPLREEVLITPNIDVTKLERGSEVLIILDERGKMLAENRGYNVYGGRVSKVQMVLDPHRVLIEEGGFTSVLFLSEKVKCQSGDEVRYDPDTKIVFEVISEKKESSFALAEQPKTTFDDVKGLKEEKEFLREKVIYPIIYNDKFRKYGIKSARGVLFHGPPGCGKTLLGEAVFNEMVKLKGGEGGHRGFFLINGPEMLEKWAGNTEEAIRTVFKEARKEAERSGFLSVIFWDEIESITGRRKDTATFSPEKTVVPTLLAEIQGINNTGNVVLIGASNRPDIIDPAIMRPGRLGDAIIEISRPNDEAAMDILNKEFNRESLPAALTALLKDGLTQRVVDHCYANTEPLAYAQKKSGEKTPMMRQELVSGALFAQIGENLVLKTCMAEINETKSPAINDAIEMVDNILLTQIGVLDAGVKSGFTIDTSNYVVDVSLNG